jgi:polysaccharide export outer membrane protein
VLPPPGPNKKSYTIAPNDKLIIDVYGIEALSAREIAVDGGGHLAFPLAGSIDAKGMTTDELMQTLTIRLSKYIRNPQVTVNLKETDSQYVTVEGDVQEPGLYPVAGQMTLIKAVARAKGATEFAKLSSVVIFRTVEGKKMAAVYNLGAIRDGIYSDPDIYPDDIVIVGDAANRRLFKSLLSIIPTLAYPIVLLLQNN